VPWPPTEDGVFEAALAALDRGRVELGARAPEGWDGKASDRIVEAILSR